MIPVFPTQWGIQLINWTLVSHQYSILVSESALGLKKSGRFIPKWEKNIDATNATWLTTKIFYLCTKCRADVLFLLSSHSFTVLEDITGLCNCIRQCICSTASWRANWGEMFLHNLLMQNNTETHRLTHPATNNEIKVCSINYLLFTKHKGTFPLTLCWQFFISFVFPGNCLVGNRLFKAVISVFSAVWLFNFCPKSFRNHLCIVFPSYVCAHFMLSTVIVLQGASRWKCVAELTHSCLKLKSLS